MPRPQPSSDRPPHAVAVGLTLALLPLLLGCSGGEGGGSADAGVPRQAGGAEQPAETDRPGRSWRGVVVDSPLAMPSVTLTDTRGRPYRLREASAGRVTLLFLGYTHCPDVCPVQMANLGAVLDDLTPSVRRQLQVVFVTVDPARDSAARIRSWLDRFGQGFVGLRGGEAEIAALQDSLRLPRAARQQRRVQGRYTMGHASQVLAFGPDGRARVAYPSGTRQRDWRHDLPRLARLVGGEDAALSAGTR